MNDPMYKHFYCTQRNTKIILSTSRIVSLQKIYPLASLLQPVVCLLEERSCKMFPCSSQCLSYCLYNTKCVNMVAIVIDISLVKEFTSAFWGKKYSEEE